MQTAHASPAPNMVASSARHIVLLSALAVACGEGATPAPEPLPVSALTGTYTLDLGRSPHPANPNLSCPGLRVTVGATPSWDASGCTFTLIRPAGMEVTADSVILHIEPIPLVEIRSFRFGGFTGTSELAMAGWSGGICVKVSAPNPCVPEFGVARWRR